MISHMFWSSLVLTLLLLGGAYVIWVLAQKEKDKMKDIGNVLAILIAIVAATVLLYGGIYGGMMGYGRGMGCGNKMVGENMMMGKMGNMNNKMMSQAMMTDYIKKCSEKDAKVIMMEMKKHHKVSSMMDSSK